MISTKIARLEPGNRLQLPADWVEALCLHTLVALEKTADGILVRPHPRATWDEVFATKLPIGSAPPGKDEDELKIAADDLFL
jgi:hypothetical protein